MKAEGRQVCSTCGTLCADNSEFCPVCALQSALKPQSSASSSEEGTSELRFEHYQVLQNEDGTPIELGRGAMGVTYKAIDIHLQCLVALKIINARFIGDDSARRRFVREARAAASVHHPNVATVFHLGESGGSYFYAMEFVDGETLEKHIQRSGTLEINVALKVVAQVAAGLTSIQKQHLVHRDIKPSNIMLTWEEGRLESIKIIDLGLAKGVAEDTISTVGSFAGTPAYASPEQFAGLGTDIRSDLYSLGITLWEMLSGEPPFQGSSVELMGQHQHAAPPIEKLRNAPAPVITLLQVLLAKDPSQRFQSPAELQKSLPRVTEAIASSSSLTLLKPTMRVLGAPRGIFMPRPVPITLDFQRNPKLRRRLYLAGVVLIVGGTLSILILPSTNRPSSVQAEKSVAVLPFDNIGSDPEQEYFSDGLTSEVIFQLSKISDVRVISRGSVLRYKAVTNAARENLRQIGTDLQVATILESSVQRVQNRLKIVTILYDARTDRQLWSASYNSEIKDLFAIQSDIAQKIAASLQVKLSDDERASIRQRPTDNLTAYDLYLRGQASYELLQKDGNDRAIQYFQQALEADPKFALGYAGLANAYIQRTLRFEGEDFWVDSAISLAQRAITLDPEQARGYAVLSRAFFYKGWLNKASESIQKALRLAPNDEEVNVRAARLLAETAQLADFYAAVRKCASLNPEDPSQPYLLAQIGREVEDHELMEKWMQRAIVLEVDPDRRRLMQCEQIIFRKDFKGAIECLQQVPPEVSAYGSSARELAVGCSERVGDWTSVVRLTSEALERGEKEHWACLHLALALRALGRDADARQKMQRLTDLARADLAVNEDDALCNFYMAAADRLLEHKDEAYQYLRKVFPRMLGYLDLWRDDWALELFAPDIEFKNMMSDFEKKIEFYRARIREIERSFENAEASSCAAKARQS